MRCLHTSHSQREKTPRTETRLYPPQRARQSYFRTVAAESDHNLQEFSAPQADLLAHVVTEAYDSLVTRAYLHELTGVVKELADAQRQTGRRMGELAEAQNHTDIQFGEMSRVVSEPASFQQQMLIRLNRNDGRSFELFLRTHLPAYLVRHLRRCRVISAEQLLDTVESRLAEELVDDLLRADLIATAVVDDRLMHLVGEVSCTADNEDVVRAARWAGLLRAAGIQAMPFVACEAIGPKALEPAGR
jgi:hypothetical protein